MNKGFVDTIRSDWERYDDPHCSAVLGSLSIIFADMFESDAE